MALALLTTLSNVTATTATTLSTLTASLPTVSLQSAAHEVGAYALALTQELVSTPAGFAVWAALALLLITSLVYYTVDPAYSVAPTSFPSVWTTRALKEMTREQLLAVDPNSRCLVIIDHHVFDLTQWIPLHPGGAIIREFAGMDATEQVRNFHHLTPLLIKKLAVYIVARVAGPRPEQSPLCREYGELRDEFYQSGLMTSSPYYYAMKLAWIVVLACWVYFASTLWAHVAGTVAARYVHMWLTGASAGMLMHQSAFLAHDSLHGSMAQRTNLDQLIGSFFGSVMFGVPSWWWKDEHNRHHAYTNTYDADSGTIIDPQVDERPLFMQFEGLFPFTSQLERCFMLIQHVLFLPAVMLLGKVGIAADGLSLTFKDVYQTGNKIAMVDSMCVGLHWTWIVMLVRTAVGASLWEMLFFFCCIAWTVGIIHIQLELTHFAMPMVDVKRYMLDNGDYCELQAITTKNIDCPPYLDWFHGGLNFQLEHHLFPRMPRENMRKVSGRVKALLKKHNVEYSHEPFFAACVSLVSWLNVRNWESWSLFMKAP